MAFLLLISCISIHASNKYVAKNGNNSNEGTQKAPFLTIQKGLDVAKAADTVFVKAGIYFECVQFPSSGTLGKSIVLKNDSVDLVTIDAQNNNICCIYAIDKGFLTIDGINVSNSTGYNVCFSGCNHISYQNATSKLPILKIYAKAGAKGIFIQSSSSNWGTDISIKNISSVGGQYGLIVGNKLNRVNITGGHYSYASIDGISIATPLTVDTSLINRNFVIDGPEVHHNLRQGIVTWGLNNAIFRNFWAHHNGASGIQIENLSSSILIEDFLCEDNSVSYAFETGVWIDDTDGAIIRRGIIRNNETGFRVSNSRNVLAHNLLIYSNNRSLAGTNHNNSSGINFSSNRIEITNNLYNCNVKLYNSVIYGNSNISSQRGAVVLQGSGTYILKNNIIANDKSKFDIFRTGTHTLISDNNLIYNTRVINIYFNSSSAYKSPMTWDSYKKVTGQDIHSVNADPRFVDAQKNYFRLQFNSPYKTVKTIIGHIDYNGNPIKELKDLESYGWVELLFKRFNID